MRRDNTDKDILQKISIKSYVNEKEGTIETRSETVGRILKHLRKRMNLTQRTIANQIGIAQQTYAGYENGKHEPSIEIAIRLANFYDISMDYITGRFAGEDSERAILEQIEAEEFLEQSAEYYADLEDSNKKFLKLIRENIKSKK